jgi:hypothetical protein
MSQALTDPVVVICPSCTTANRVPASRMLEGPKCGRCGHMLILFAGGKEIARSAGAMNQRAIAGWTEQHLPQG